MIVKLQDVTAPKFREIALIQALFAKKSVLMRQLLGTKKLFPGRR